MMFCSYFRRGRIRSNVSLMMVVAMIIIFQHAATASSTAAPYTSVASLDQYGQSAQLRNALVASSRHGKLIVAATCSCKDIDGDNCIVVCSTRSKPRNRAIKSSSSSSLIIQVLSTAQCTAYTAMVNSGMRSDASLLLQLLRDYARRVWDHYDTVPSGACMADALGGVLVRCMSYDVSEEICGYGVGHVISSDNNGDEDDGFNMARPFGVSSLILDVRKATTGTPASTAVSHDKNDKHMQHPSIHVSCISVDPSGTQQHWLASAMGTGSEDGKRLLEVRWNKNMSKDEVIKMCADIVREVSLGSDVSANSSTDLEIECEVLSIDGIARVPISRDDGNSTIAAVEH